MVDVALDDDDEEECLAQTGTSTMAVENIGKNEM